MERVFNKQHEKESKFWVYLDKKGKIKVAAAFFITSFGLFMVVPIMVTKYQYPLYYTYLRAFIGGAMVSSNLTLTLSKKRIPAIIIFFLCMFFLIGSERFFRTQLFPETVAFYNVLIVWTCLVSTFAGLGILYNLTVNEGQKTIKMKTTLELAEEIHNTLVPAIEETSDKLNIFGLSESIESMGGDLIDYISLDGQRTVYIADVSGHGVSAGIVMSMFKGAMRTMAQDKQTIDRLFTKVNHALTPIKKKNMFLTAAGITFDDSSCTAMISSAGHLPVLHFSKKTEGFYRHHVKQIPLGVTEQTEYKGLQVPYDQGDYFVLLTDGLTENKNNFDNLAMLTTIEECLAPKLKKDTPLDTVSKELFADMKKQGEPIDDRSIIIIKCI